MQISQSELEIWYPSFLDIIVQMWGSKQLQKYLDEILLLSGDEYHRQGFPLTVMSELMMLYFVNNELLAEEDETIWNMGKRS